MQSRNRPKPKTINADAQKYVRVHATFAPVVKLLELTIGALLKAISTIPSKMIKFVNPSCLRDVINHTPNAVPQTGNVIKMIEFNFSGVAIFFTFSICRMKLTQW